MTRGPVTVGEAAAVAAAFARYRGFVLPRVRRELAEWREAAERIPDPLLRGQAVKAVTDKASNVEATAVFAILAPRSSRPSVTRASTALQVAIDYLDSLGEDPGPDRSWAACSSKYLSERGCRSNWCARSSVASKR